MPGLLLHLALGSLWLSLVTAAPAASSSHVVLAGLDGRVGVMSKRAAPRVSALITMSPVPVVVTVPPAMCASTSTSASLNAIVRPIAIATPKSPPIATATAAAIAVAWIWDESFASIATLPAVIPPVPVPFT